MLKKILVAVCLFFNFENSTMFQSTVVNLVKKKQLPSTEIINAVLVKYLGASSRDAGFDSISDTLAHQELTQSEIDDKLHRWYFGPHEPYFPTLTEIAKEIYKKSK